MRSWWCLDLDLERALVAMGCCRGFETWLVKGGVVGDEWDCWEGRIEFLVLVLVLSEW